VVPGPDFSYVDSLAKAADMHAEGGLERLYLYPLEFGGQDVAENFVYVPIGVVDIKFGIDNNIIRPLVDSGKVTKYRTSLDYQGDSVIPVAINIDASEPGRFSTTIKIWGDALQREGSG
jgi:hypothetical protein